MYVCMYFGCIGLEHYKNFYFPMYAVHSGGIGILMEVFCIDAFHGYTFVLFSVFETCAVHCNMLLVVSVALYCAPSMR